MSTEKKHQKNERQFFVESRNSDCVPVKFQTLQYLYTCKIPYIKQIHMAKQLVLLNYENKCS